jgi:hypothetical protein
MSAALRFKPSSVFQITVVLELVAVLLQQRAAAVQPGEGAQRLEGFGRAGEIGLAS